MKVVLFYLNYGCHIIAIDHQVVSEP